LFENTRKWRVLWFPFFPIYPRLTVL
jgi:hypothetical protein